MMYLAYASCFTRTGRLWWARGCEWEVDRIHGKREDGRRTEVGAEGNEKERSGEEGVPRGR